MADNFQTVQHTLTVGSNQHLPYQSVSETVSVADLIAFTKNTVFSVTLSQSLQLISGVGSSQTADPLNLSVVTTATVAETLTPDKVKSSEGEVVTLSDSILTNLSLVRSITDQIQMSESLAIWLGTYEYVDPAVKSYISGLTAISEVTFSWSTYSITLRKPEFSDTDEYSVFRVERTNRGGDLQIFQDPDWPITEILQMEFAYIDSTTAADFLIFLNHVLGQEVTFKDYVGRTWKGYILTPTGDVVQKGRYNYTIKMRFQGTLQ